MAEPDATELAELVALFGRERFVAAPEALKARLAGVRGLILDWDGVLGTGAKGPDAPAVFNEIDAMGLNLLRFALWRRQGALPPVAVISGQHDPAAEALAAREHLDAVYLGFLDKRLALEHLCAAQRVSPAELAFFFDDVLDLAVAERCGGRFLVGRGASPLLERHVRRRGLCDYVVAAPAGAGAVREACELALGLLGEADQVFAARAAWDGSYARYFEERQRRTTAHWVAGRDPSTGEPTVLPARREP